MNNHNDFGLKKVDLNKRKLKKKNNFFIPLILVISVLTIVLLNNYQDLSFNKNIDNKYSKEFISSESPVVIDIVETDSLNNDDSIPLKVINQSQIKFEKQIVELDSLTGNYFIIEGSFSNYNLSLNRAMTLSDQGFQPIIIIPKNNNMHRVAVDMYTDLEIAKESLEAYRNKLNNKLWILRF